MKTPIRDSMALSKVAGTSVYIKMDSAQPSGSFKIRGIGHLCQTVQGGSGEGGKSSFLNGQGRCHVEPKELQARPSDCPRGPCTHP